MLSVNRDSSVRSRCNNTSLESKAPAEFFEKEDEKWRLDSGVGGSDEQILPRSQIVLGDEEDVFPKESTDESVLEFSRTEVEEEKEGETEETSQDVENYKEDQIEGKECGSPVSSTQQSCDEDPQAEVDYTKLNVQVSSTPVTNIAPILVKTWEDGYKPRTKRALTFAEGTVFQEGGRDACCLKRKAQLEELMDEIASEVLTDMIQDNARAAAKLAFDTKKPANYRGLYEFLEESEFIQVIQTSANNLPTYTCVELYHYMKDQINSYYIQEAQFHFQKEKARRKALKKKQRGCSIS